MRSSSIPPWQRIGSGTIVLSAVAIAVFVLFGLGHLVGWNPTWRSVGVTPLEPHFFDMHAVTDHAECAAKGFDAYSLNSCDPRTAFNYPPVWLLLGRLGIDGSDSVWLSVVMIVVALAVMVAIFKGRSIGDGAIFAAAILSPVGADGRRAWKRRFFHFGLGRRGRFSFHRAKDQSNAFGGFADWSGNRVKAVSPFLYRAGSQV